MYIIVQDKVVARLVKQEGMVFVVGDWPGTATAPVRKLVRKLQQRCRVVVAYEYNTSAMSACCGERQEKKSNRIMRCPSCTREMDRDINGAMNMMELLRQRITDGTRPKYLQWPDDMNEKVRIWQEIGWVKWRLFRLFPTPEPRVP